MKKMMIVLLMGVTSLQLKAAGTEGVGGGTTIASDFVSHGRLVLEYIISKSEDFPEVDTEALQSAIEKTKVFVKAKVDSTFLGSNIAIEASFDRAKGEIYITKNWMKKSLADKKKLALHEYLGILGLEVNTYPISSRLENSKLIEKMNIENVSLNRFGFPNTISLSHLAKSGISCSDDCPALVQNTLTTIPEPQAQLDYKDNPRIQNFLKSFGARKARVYAYRISTPGSSYDPGVYIEFSKILMDQMGCGVTPENRKITNAADMVFGSVVPDDIPTQAAATNTFFQLIFQLTRSLGEYDKDSKFPYYYPQFKPLKSYVGFKCYKHIYSDEDGVSMGENYGGLFIGDEVDFSSAAKLPPVGNLGNSARIGFVVLFGG